MTHVFGVDDVFEVLQANLAIFADASTKDVFQPLKILGSQLAARTEQKSKQKSKQNL